MFYFIADPHFGHRNVLKLCDRPFETGRSLPSGRLCALDKAPELNYNKSGPFLCEKQRYRPKKNNPNRPDR